MFDFFFNFSVKISLFILSLFQISIKSINIHLIIRTKINSNIYPNKKYFLKYLKNCPIIKN